MASTPDPIRRITPDEMPTIKALAYAAQLSSTHHKYDEANAILEDAIAVYGRLPPYLVSQYSTLVGANRMGPVEALKVLSTLLLPAELDMPAFKLIRLTLIITGIAELPGYGRLVASALDEARAMADDEQVPAPVRQRVRVLLNDANVATAAAAS